MWLRRGKNPSPGPDALGTATLIVSDTGEQVHLPYVYSGLDDGYHWYEVLVGGHYRDLLFEGRATIRTDVIPAKTKIGVDLGGGLLRFP